MLDHPQLAAALTRLAAALDWCEAAAERLDRAGAANRDLAVTLAAAGEAHDRLAAERDEARARTRELEHATAEVAQRLGQAGGTLRRLLAEAG